VDTQPKLDPGILHVVLIGLMGAGKTSVGQELAERLGWPLSDSDEVIEREQGATVRELNERLGTEAMHDFESEHLLTAVAVQAHSVISAAASVIDDARCREAITRPDVFAAWLEVNPGRLAARFARGSHRPVLGSDAERMFRRQLAQRARWFEQVADYRVRADRGNAARTATEVAEVLTSRAR
jgi:shikimate kinase